MPTHLIHDGAWHPQRNVEEGAELLTRTQRPRLGNARGGNTDQLAASVRHFNKALITRLAHDRLLVETVA